MSVSKIPLPVRIVASVLLLAFVLSKVDIGSLFQYVSTSNPFLILLAALIAVVGFLINTYKWQVLLSRPGAHITYRELLRLNFIGLFYNLVLPGQVGGEVVKSVSLARKGVGTALAAVSVAADRVTGLLALFMLGIAGALLTPSVTSARPELLSWLVGLTCLFACATVILLTGRGQAAVLAVGRMLPVGQSQKRLGALSGLLATPTRGWSSLWIPLLLSVLIQALIAYTNLLVCSSLGLPIAYVQLLWVVAVVSLLQSLPISIAGIGVREGAYVYLLQQQGVVASSALALSLVVFAIQVFMAAIGGLLQLQSLARKRET